MEEDELLNTSPLKGQFREEVSFFSNLFFCWTIPTFIKGSKKELEENDLQDSLENDKSDRLANALEKTWERERLLHKDPSLWKALRSAFGINFLLYGLLWIVLETLRIAQTLALGHLILYYMPNQLSVTKAQAYVCTAIIVTSTLLNLLGTHNCTFHLQHLGLKMRIACCTLLYRKMLRLTKTALNQTTTGELVNLFSNDVNRFDTAVFQLHNLWLCPLEAVVILYLLYLHVGVTASVGVIFLTIFIPLQILIGKKTSVYRLRIALRVDERIRLMNEIIRGIRVIKMYVWEKPFLELVHMTRKIELKQVKHILYLRSLTLSFTIFTTRLALFLSLIVNIYLGNNPTAYYVFVVTSFYNILRVSITMNLPQAIGQLAELNVSINRIKRILMLEETIIDEHELEEKIQNEADDITLSVSNSNESNIRIHLESATIGEGFLSPENQLTGVSFKVHDKELVIIVGPVGSGKSSLLHTLLKEMPVHTGSISVLGSVSYAAQEPWLFASTIKQNILFGNKMNLKRYQEVIKVCALERDFSLLPQGDLTIVGDRGTTLSGGQKARLNLARAVYKEADIYLLDDPLSAVDTHVGKQLFQECISTFLKNKTVILVTHQLQYIRYADCLLLVENGKVSAQDVSTDIQEISERLVKQDKKNEWVNDYLNHVANGKDISQNGSNISTIKEQRSFGTVSRKVYENYVCAGGGFFNVTIIVIWFMVAQSMANGGDYFITLWVNFKQQYTSQNGTNMSYIDTSSSQKYLYNTDTSICICALLITLTIILTLYRSFKYYNFTLRATSTLHNKMLSNIIQCSMNFFNENPSGRILNRFSKDIGVSDEILPTAIMDSLQIFFVSAGIMTMTVLVNMWLIIPIAIIMIAFYRLRRFYLTTSRNVKRLEGITRSPIFTHLSSSLHGLVTIRAFKAQTFFKKEFDNYQDINSSAHYTFLGCSNAFGFCIDAICGMYISLVTFSFLFAEEQYGGNVGLAITQTVGLMGMVQWGIRQWSEIENHMVSVERILEYTEVPSEEVNTQIKSHTKNWPQNGKIQFQSVSLKYSSKHDYVLKDLNFIIAAKEKVGIVGRTGAGKSSLISALFLLEKIKGDILIDDVNIKEIPLANLRSSITIIPQEPVLFTGTLRKNLDPFDEYTDETLWKALEELQLKSVILDLPFGLDYKLSEGGYNFSVGQRQLLCLARAIIRKNKILILDEATANVDHNTDELIHTTIRKIFANCTVITIAHRLHTVMNSDKVLVLDAGSVVEFDKPCVLLENENGFLSKLVSHIGSTMEDNLRQMSENVLKLQ